MNILNEKSHGRLQYNSLFLTTDWWGMGSLGTDWNSTPVWCRLWMSFAGVPFPGNFSYPGGICIRENEVIQFMKVIQGEACEKHFQIFVR